MVIKCLLEAILDIRSRISVFLSITAVDNGSSLSRNKLDVSFCHAGCVFWAKSRSILRKSLDLAPRGGTQHLHIRGGRFDIFGYECCQK